jgi:NADPH-dependent glutamate synthase beta subunit-like oxidoreductase/2,4-dienoyl-CoA reductase-like NADH-dependent reductase (Old Yellow Enzyme family)
MHEPFHFHSLDELRGRIAELGLDLAVADDIGVLFAPVHAGPFHLANRLVVLPMEGCDGLPDGSPDELTFRRYRRFAEGGAALLWMEATAVVEEGRANPRQLWLTEGNVAAFARLADETRAAAARTMGAGHRPVLVLQLTHSGRYSRPGRTAAPIIAHRSPLLDPIHNLPPDYPVITDEQLERLEDEYVRAALLAARAGFDAVDIKACHRYLVSELHASHTRDGSYGGSFENRTRFFRNVVAKIKDAAPGLVVTSRMNAYDAMAYPYGFGVDRADPLKADLAEPMALVRYLEEQGAPLVNVTIGNPYFNPHVNRPFDLPVAGGALPPEPPLAGVARFTGVVGRIQSSFPGIAVVGGGYSWLRQLFPHVAAAHVNSGAVTLVGVGRMAFAYPDFARDLARTGRLDPERVCVACSACTQIMRDGGRTGCVPRDAAVYEPIYKSGRAEALDTIVAMAATCRQCNDPTCIRHCPAHVNIPEFVGHIAARRFRQAYESLREANVLAAVCGYVCPAETLCESACINEHYSSTVPIRHLQRWVSRKAVEEGWVAEPRPARPPNGRTVAVLGAGPAGVSAAATLAGLGHKVTIFDAAPEAGGTPGETIPEQRLPHPLLRREIRDLLQSAGNVECRRASIGPELDLDRILGQEFDGLVVALGLSQSVRLTTAAPPSSGAVGALEFLRQSKAGMNATGNVLVVGGGNTAMDAAVSALRAGASDAFIVYRRSFAEMPAWPEEREAAIRSGVHFLILTAPLGYNTDADGKVTGLRVARTALGPAGPDGRRIPAIMPGTEHVIPADLVIEAVGQEAAPELRQALSALRLTSRGLIWTRPGSLQTSRDAVFAAGDIVNGGTTVVQAVAEGARAARELDVYLQTAYADARGFPS